MRRQAAYLAGAVVFLVPAFWVVGFVYFIVTNGIEDCEGEIGGIGCVEQRLCAVFSTREREGIDLLELACRSDSDSGSWNILTPSVVFEMGLSGRWDVERYGMLV